MYRWGAWGQVGLQQHRQGHGGIGLGAWAGMTASVMVICPAAAVACSSKGIAGGLPLSVSTSWASPLACVHAGHFQMMCRGCAVTKTHTIFDPLQQAGLPTNSWVSRDTGRTCGLSNTCSPLCMRISISCAVRAALLLLPLLVRPVKPAAGSAAAAATAAAVGLAAAGAACSGSCGGLMPCSARCCR